MKLLVLHLTNLTEARYFSARMADFLHFEIKQDLADSLERKHLTLSAFHAIADWLEGPRVVLSGDEDTVSAIRDRAVEEVGLLIDDTLEYDGEHYAVVKTDGIAKPENSFVLLEKVEDVEYVNKMAIRPFGVALMARGEAEVGFLEFGSIDNILDRFDELTLG